MHYTFQPYQPKPVLRDHLNLGGSAPDGGRIDITSQYIERDGQPWIGVMAEYHFSRDSRDRWYDELSKMKAGGVTVLATYVFWIYHEEIEGQYDFTGDRDLRAFVQTCAEVGLDVVIRIGPWAHGECRNGGFPDWLLQKDCRPRSNDPAYLALARRWYEQVAAQVQGLFYGDGGCIIAVQLENELVNNGPHLATLKQIAQEVGLIAPIYTVTGWNSAAGAEIPVDEVLPVFGGYIEAPWDQHKNQLPPSPHFFFQQMRNDSAIGLDLLPQVSTSGWQLPYERYPFATCELGGGIQVTHHRRPIISPMDTYALSLVKLGCGNNLVGYYMYHGGTNKIGQCSTLQESTATGYPNDYPILSYDFQGVLSEYGEVREQYRLLNLLHLFVQSFGAALAPMEAVDAAAPVAREDTTSLRYGMRTNGDSGFVFVNHHQRLTELADLHDVVLDTGDVQFPPVNVVGDTCFFLPFRMPVGDALLTCATAQPLCRAGDTYFFMAIDHNAPVYHFASGEIIAPAPGMDSAFAIGGVNVVTLTMAQARYLRLLDGTAYLGDGCDLFLSHGAVTAAAEGSFAYWRWDGNAFVPASVERPFRQANWTLEPTAEPFRPTYEEELNMGGPRARDWYQLTVDGDGGFVTLDIPCDAAQIYADGQMVADNYYFGQSWRVPAALLYGKTCYLVVSELKDDFYREF